MYVILFNVMGLHAKAKKIEFQNFRTPLLVLPKTAKKDKKNFSQIPKKLLLFGKIDDFISL